MKTEFSRRQFLKHGSLAAASLTAAAGPRAVAATAQSIAEASPSANPLPRWRGFNLQYLYMMERGIHPPVEDHFRWISEWGFDFVRMPMTYRAWLKRKVRRGEGRLTIDDVYQIDESALEFIDRAVEYAEKHRVHLNLCFHHAPGYRIGISDRLGEPFLLFRDRSAVDAFAFHWEMFAKRYRAVGREKLSFNLFNEAPWYSDDFNGEVYKDAIIPAVEAIRRVSPERIIIADGAGAGNLSVPELVPLKISQSIHCYIPGNISHYKVDWMKDRTDWPEPKWPGAVDEHGYTWDRARMEQFYRPWRRLVESGVGVHMGETSGSHRLPHTVFLAWLTDVLEFCREINIGYSLWDFIGESKFGILDSDRADLAYEDWYGHKLDRKMLELLQRY